MPGSPSCQEDASAWPDGSTELIHVGSWSGIGPPDKISLEPGTDRCPVTVAGWSVRFELNCIILKTKMEQSYDFFFFLNKI